MVSFITHIGIGIILAEILLRKIDDDPEFRKDNRVKYWWAGALGGLLPDLDVIPSLITGAHPYAYHHIYTHTFLAIGILFLILLLTKFNPFALAFVFGYYAHLGTDFIDNSISPLGPFDTSTQWGLIAGWSQIPGGGWQSEFWLQSGYKFDNDLWSIFMKNGWGIRVGIEFLSYYDLAIMAISIPLMLAMFYSTFKRAFSKKKK